ncbi:hypothetical protein MKX01_040952 [Papaver californicum]|nr:hypothetical protein MKX01_040952 [Papaver californicum]
MGLLARAILCFLLLIHLSLSLGSYYATAVSGYEQGNESNVQGGGLMVRINRRLGHGGGGSHGGGLSSSPSNGKNNNGGGTSSRRVPYTGGVYGTGVRSHHNMSAPLSCKRNNIGLLAAFNFCHLLSGKVLKFVIVGHIFLFL